MGKEHLVFTLKAQEPTAILSTALAAPIGSYLRPALSMWENRHDSAPGQLPRNFTLETEL